MDCILMGLSFGIILIVQCSGPIDQSAYVDLTFHFLYDYTLIKNSCIACIEADPLHPLSFWRFLCLLETELNESDHIASRWTFLCMPFDGDLIWFLPHQFNFFCESVLAELLFQIFCWKMYHSTEQSAGDHQYLRWCTRYESD